MTTKSEKRIAIGAQINLGKKAVYLRLPDGTVVTARGAYTVAHVGEHVAGGLTFHGIKPNKSK